jgi:XTP/dITP diphosphohydrolase
MLLGSVQIVRLDGIGCQEAITETSATIERKEIEKANYILENYGFHRFADETGLEVKVKKKQHSVFSARYAGKQRNADDHMNKLLPI